MKMKPEHYAQLRDAFAGIADKIASHRAAIAAAGVAKDVDKRTRWDALYALRRECPALPANFVTDTLYSYLDDSHIDTALRAVMREVQL